MMGGAGARRQGGATMAEFIVVASFVLVPLMMLMPLMGKYIDTRHKVEQAARYAAWERTAWFDPSSPSASANGLPFALKSKDATAIENEIQGRILAKADTAVHADQTAGATAPELDAMQHYTNRGNGKYEPLLEVKNATKPGFFGSHISSNSKPPGAASSGINAVLSAAEIAGFEVDTQGLYTSRFELDMQEPKWLKAFENLDVKFSAQHMLFTDGWGAGGKKHNIDMVQGLLPTALLGEDLPKKLAEFVAKIPIAQEVAPDELIFGHVDVDAVPGQRLATD